MVSPELLGSLKTFVSTGQTAESVKKILVGAGWREEEINQAILELGGSKIFEKQEEAVKSAGSRVVEIPSHAKQKRHLLIKLSLVGLLLVFIFSGYWFLEGRSSSGLFRAAFSSLGDFRLDAKGKIEREAIGSKERDGISDLEINFDLGGSFRFKGLPWPRANSNINFSLKGGRIPEATGALEFLSLDRTIYVKMNRAGGWAGFLNADPLFGKWVRIEDKDVFKIPYLWDDLNKDRSSIGTGIQLLDPERNKIEAVLMGADIFEVKERLPDEVTNGEEAYHLSLGVRAEDLRGVLRSWARLGKGVLSSSTATTSSFPGLLGNEVEVTGGGEVWISKKLKVPVRLAADIKLKSNGYQWVLTWDGLYSGFRETVQVEPPVPVEPFAGLTKVFGGAFDSQRRYNLELIQELLLRYRKKCGFYPGGVNCIRNFSGMPWGLRKLFSVLEGSDLEAADLRSASIEEDRYQYGTNGEFYLLGVRLDDATYSNSRGVSGKSFGVDCRRPVFCVAASLKP